MLHGAERHSLVCPVHLHAETFPSSAGFNPTHTQKDYPPRKETRVILRAKWKALSSFPTALLVEKPVEEK